MAAEVHQSSISSTHAAPKRQTFAWLTPLVILSALLILCPALLQPAQFIQDDSYFYLQIATNIVEGHGSTFHGLTPTNGYHPLWMGGAVAAVFLAGGDKATALHVVIILQAMLALGAAWLFLHLTRQMDLKFGLTGVAVLLSYLLGTGIYGSEAHLNALTLTAALILLWRALTDDRMRIWFAAGVVFGLATLARLDNVFVAATSIGVAIFFPGWRGPGPAAKRSLFVGLGGTLVVLPYLVCNWIMFDHLMPISGAIKSEFPSFDFDLNKLGAMGKLAAPFGLVLVAMGEFIDDDRRRRTIWRGLGYGVLVHALYVTGFTDHYTFWPWYYVSGVLAASFAATYLPDWVLRRAPSGAIAAGLRPAIIVVTFVILLGGAARAWLKAFNPIRLGHVTLDIPVNAYRWPEEFAGSLDEYLPAGSAIFVLDWPGALAYYSELRVLPMDGLVNDFAYNDELLAMGAEQYLCSRNVDYYFGLIDEAGPTQRVAVEAPLYHRPAGQLTLHREDMLVTVREVVSRPEEALPFAVWRLRCTPP